MTKRNTHSKEFIFCACGCGEKRLRYDLQGRERKYITHHQLRGFKFSKESILKMRLSHIGQNTGSSNYQWKGGRRRHMAGYILLQSKGHPFADSHGYVLEHRLVMEQYLGRYLTKDEVVHHKNDIKDDNRIENLEIMTRAQHMAYHLRPNSYD